MRARCPGDIERVSPGVAVQTNAGSDYGYRTTLPRRTVVAALAERLLDIDYDNFKDSVAETDRHAAYFEIWRTLHRFQQSAQHR